MDVLSLNNGCPNIGHIGHFILWEILSSRKRDTLSFGIRSNYSLENILWEIALEFAIWGVRYNHSLILIFLALHLFSLLFFHFYIFNGDDCSYSFFPRCMRNIIDFPHYSNIAISLRNCEFSP